MLTVAEQQTECNSHDFESVGSILRRALAELEEKMTTTFNSTVSLEIDAVVQEIDQIVVEHGKEGLANDNGEPFLD
jgi:hypothetical protein